MSCLNEPIRTPALYLARRWCTQWLLLLSLLAAGAVHADPFASGRPADSGTRRAVTDAASSGTNSLGAYLDAQGYLDLPQGFAGSIDPAGFELVSKPGERPRFRAKAMASDARWSDEFGLRHGCNGGVYAAAVGGDGALYLGGGFTVCGDIPANHIVRFDPLSGAWSAVGSGDGNGVDGDVNDFAVAGGELFVGGIFAVANVGTSPVPANNIARWDGASWSALGSGGGNGVNERVKALALLNSDLYVGGSFTEANVGAGISANRIARWDTALGTWSALGSGGGNGVNSNVQALAVGNGYLYVGGFFTVANVGANIPANRIARWNPVAMTWGTLGGGGGGVDGPVLALATSGPSVYVGGQFTQANIGASPIAANNLVRWAGLAWATVGSGGGNGVDAQVAVLTVSGTDLLVGGNFDTVNVGAGIDSPRIARWSGSAWSSLGSGGGNGVAGSRPWTGVYAIAEIAGELFVGGAFAAVNAGAPIVASSIARWDGATWSALDAVAGNGVSGEIYAMAVSGPDLYIGGWFNAVGDLGVNNVAHWNGSAWSALGSDGGNGVPCCVNALAVSGSDLYVGGGFGEANLDGPVVAVNRIARWDGTQWSALGSGGGNGVNSSVNALAASGSTLYVAGNFNEANVGGPPVAANKVVRWGGSGWSALGSNGGNGVDGGALALAVSGNDLYVGGYFQTANIGANPQTVVRRIARWDGTSWSALGSGGGRGVNGPVYALAVMGGAVYAGGDFTHANTEAPAPTPANNIARWDGSAWSALGSAGGNGVNGRVRALAADGTGVYAGGDFTQANVGADLAASHIARWDGSAWSSLGSGISGRVYAAAMAGSNLYAGGVFGTAGGKVSANIGRYETSDRIHADGFENP